MAGNIHLNFTANSNMAAVQAQMESMRKVMHRMQADVQKFNKTVALQGTSDFSGWDRMNSGITTYRNEMNNLAQQSGAYTTATRTLTSATTQFNNALGRQSVRLRDVIGQGGKVRSAMREQMALNNMIARGFKMDATGRIDADLWVPRAGDIGRFESLNKQIGYYNHILRSVSQETVNWGKNTQWTGRQLTVGFSVPISIAMGLLGKFALQADTDLTRIVKVYGDTESAFDATTESIRNMATSTAIHIAQEFGKAADETREVMAELAATGLGGPELQGMTYQVQRLSMLGEMDSSEALKLSRILKEVYGFSSAELEKQVNYFNAIENSTALTLQDITEGMPRIAGIMKSTGTSIQEQTELLVAFKSAGIDVAEGANALKSINFKAVAATPTAAGHFFRITGVEMQDLIDQTEGRFIPTLLAIADTMRGLDDQAKVDLVARVFGIHQGSRAITLLDQLSEGSEGMMRAIEIGHQSAEEHAVAARGEIEALQESASFRFNAMIQSIRANMESIGQVVLEVLIPVGEYINRLFAWIEGLDESTKKWVVTMSAILAAVGPFVMLIGLFANLVGMAGRGVGAVMGLFFKFEILNAETKAGRLLQEAYNKTLGAGTLERENHRRSIEGMTRALEAYNNTMNAQTAIQGRQATSPQDYFIRTGKQPSYNERIGPLTRDQDLALNGPSAANSNAMTRVEYHKQARAEIEKTNASTLKFAQGMGVASAAALTLGTTIQNDTITRIGGIGLAISSVLPLLPMLNTGFNRFFAGMGRGTTVVGRHIVDTFAAVASGSKAMLRGIGTFMMGPWGLLLGAALAGVGYLWVKHRREVKETKEMYESLADSVDVLAGIYDFAPTTPLQREMNADPHFDPNTRWGQNQRINAWRESDDEDRVKLYERLVEWSRRWGEELDADTHRQMVLNEAISQGAMILATTGDPEKAREVAWDTLRVMTDEFMEYDDFLITVGLDDRSVKSVLDDVNSAAMAAGKALDDSFNMVMEYSAKETGIPGLDEYQQNFQKDLEQLSLILQSTPDVETIYRALEGSDLAGTAQLVVDAYHEAVRKGLTKEDETFRQFAERLHTVATPEMHYAREADQLTTLEGIGSARLRTMQMTLLSLDKQNSGLLEQLEIGQDLATAVSGRDAVIRQIAGVELDILEAKAEQARLDGRAVDAAHAILQASRLRAQAEWQYALNDGMGRAAGMLREVGDIAQGLPGPLSALGIFGEQSGKQIADGFKDAADELSDLEQQAYDLHRNSMEHYQNALVDHYVDQMDANQQAEKAALDAEGKRLMEGIDARYKIREEAMAVQHEARQDALSAEHERQQEALGLERERAQEEMRKAREAAQEALDERHKNETRAERDAQRLENKALDDAHKRRRKQIEEVWDVQIERIQHQINEEERLEAIRQRLFDNERQRISRLREMFSGNIDLNMAINTGDLDEAARISNEMSTKRSEWAIDDLSQIMADGSQTRKDVLQNRIDELNEEKNVELENIKEVEEAEKESLRRRQENQSDNLQKRQRAEKKALQEEYRLLEKALSDDFKAREKHLRDTQDAAKKALDKRLEDERQALQDARDNERAAQEEATRKNKEELDKQHADAKAAYDLRAAYWRDMVATNRTEADRMNEAMFEDFKDNHLEPIQQADYDTRQAMWKDTRRMQQEELDKIAQDAAWEDMAKTIAESVMKGSIGFGMTPGQIGKFIRTGELPKNPNASIGALNRDGSNPYMDRAYHSGGIAGRPGDSSWSGPGFRGASQEVPATLLKGEGILNLQAMNTPGVPEMVQGLNKGALGATAKPTAGMNKRAYGDGPGLPGMLAPMKVMMAALAQRATERGVQVGISKMEPIVEIILKGKNAGLLSGEQLRNAEAIMATGFKMGVSERDIMTALMTAMQESSLRNINYGDDIHGVRNPDGTLTSSVGLFQQQKWWGSLEDRMDPFKSSELFFKALLDVRNREEMPMWAAAQAVQRSAYPMAYARHEGLARTLMENARLLSLGALSDADFQGGRSGKGMAWQSLWGLVRRAAPEAQMTSNFRPGATTAGYGSVSYHALGRAIDVVSSNMMQTFRKVRGLLPWSELIYTPAGRGQMQNGRSFWDFSPITKAQHYDHIHLAYKNGGSVPGLGKGDKVPAMLEPGEFVVRSSVADKSREFLSALNNGDFNFMPTAGLGRTNVNATGNIDTSGHNTYNVNMNFDGPVNSDLDIRKAVFSVFKEIERGKPRSRRVTH